MKLSKKQKGTIGMLIYSIGLLVLGFFVKYSFPMNAYFIFFYFLFIILIFVFEEDVQTIIRMTVAAVSLFSLSILLFLWVFEMPLLNQIPIFKNGVTNEFVIAFFTIILTVSTIVNLIIYKKSVILSRLTVLSISLDEDFFLKIHNVGDYPANQIKVDIDIRKKPYIKRINLNNLTKKESLINVFKQIKLNFWSSDRSDFGYLEPNEISELDIISIIREHYPNLKSNEKGGHRKISSDKEEKFKIIVNISFYNDVGDKAPLPILRIFKVTINEGGVHFER